MGSSVGGEAPSSDIAWTPMELYNLKQVYFFLCLHTTTLTSCQLNLSQWDSLFTSAKMSDKALWRMLFHAICQPRSSGEGRRVDGQDVFPGALGFEEFLSFIRVLKRGSLVERRKMCFSLWDPNQDGVVERTDFRRVTEVRMSSSRRGGDVAAEVDEEVRSFFALVDEDFDDQFDYGAFDHYCAIYGDAIVTSTLKVFETMFDRCIDETGISITSTDVKNSKPHIDWQDHKIQMSGLLCCSSQAPVFTKAPQIA